MHIVLRCAVCVRACVLHAHMPLQPGPGTAMIRWSVQQYTGCCLVVGSQAHYAIWAEPLPPSSNKPAVGAQCVHACLCGSSLLGMEKLFAVAASMSGHDSVLFVILLANACTPTCLLHCLSIIVICSDMAV